MPNHAPSNPCLGAMLPYTPLHHLLLAELDFPVVATSGNLSDEPICTDEREALERLGGIADVFLIHNRPIVRHVDDSIVRVMLDRELVLRRARGYAPLPITLKSEIRNPKSEIVLAVGAHLKNAIALSVGNQVFISQHIGDLETEQAHFAFRRVIADFENLYEARPQIIAADLHPDYLSTKFALERRSPARLESKNAGGQHAGSETSAPIVMQVQHHIAHVLSCMAENEIAPPALGVSWDGTGYGTDGTIWGGEFFLVTDESVERIAHLRPFRLPGGDKAVKEPRRTALGLLHEISGDKVFEQKKLAAVAAFSSAELATLKTMLVKKLNSPVTTSMGRLFDAVASLINLRQQIRFEGQAAMELEFALEGAKTDEYYNCRSSRARSKVGRASRLPGKRGSASRQKKRLSSRCARWGRRDARPTFVHPRLGRRWSKPFWRMLRNGIVPWASSPPNSTTRWRKASLPLPNAPARSAWCFPAAVFRTVISPNAPCGVCRRRAFGRTGISACRRTTAGLRWDKSLPPCGGRSRVKDHVFGHSRKN